MFLSISLKERRLSEGEAELMDSRDLQNWYPLISTFSYSTKIGLGGIYPFHFTSTITHITQNFRNTISMTIQTMTLGYARMGKRREVKKALEPCWNGMSDADTMLQTVREIEAHRWKTLNVGLANLPTQQIGVNPDWGLKTRCWEVVVPSLKHRVAATQKPREEINATTH